jgi:hypothetical protein
MRTSSFSSPKVIDLLNHYFVPIHLGNQDYGEKGSAPAEDKAAKNRIYREALAAGMHAGSVCAYLIAPDGRPLAVAPLNENVAADPDKLAELMERVIRELKISKGETLVAPQPRSAPQADADDLVLHIVARYLRRRGNDFVPFDVKDSLGTRQAIGWGNLPSEEYIVLGKTEWSKLLPPGNVGPQTDWQLDRKTAGRILDHFYPPTENTDLARNRIDEQSLQAKVESIQGGLVWARLEGRFRMKHPFYHKDDNHVIAADLVGHLEFDAGSKRIRSLRLVTGQGTYGDGKNVQYFGAAADSTASRK